jgi:hypothetical protein
MVARSRHPQRRPCEKTREGSAHGDRQVNLRSRVEPSPDYDCPRTPPIAGASTASGRRRARVAYGKE